MSDEQATARPWTLEVSTEGDDGMMVTISEIERCLHDWEWADAEDWERDLMSSSDVLTK